MPSPVYRIRHERHTEPWVYSDLDDIEYEAVPCLECRGAGCLNAGEYCYEEEGMLSNQWIPNHYPCSQCEGQGYIARMLP